MKNKLRSVISLGLAGVMAASLLSGCAFTETAASKNKAAASEAGSETSADNSSGKINIKVAGVSADGATYTYGMKKFKELLEEKSDKFKVTLYMGDMSSDEAELFELAQSGDIQIAWIGTGSISSFVPETQILDLPYLFSGQDDVEKFVASDVGDEFLQTISDKVDGITAIAFHQDGWRALTTTDKEVKSLEDAKGIKVRCMQSDMFIQTYKALGMEPTALAYSDLYTSLETGVVDAQDNGLMYAIPDGYAEIQKYVTYDYLSWTAGIAATNTSFLDGLSDEDEEMVIECAKEAGEYQRTATWDQEMKYAKQEEEDGKMTVCYKLDDQDKWKEAVQPVYDNFYKEHPDWKATVDKIQALFA